MLGLEGLQSAKRRLTSPKRPKPLRVRHMTLSIQPTPHMLGEAALETMAVGVRVVGHDDCAVGVEKRMPAELFETAVLVTALGEVRASEGDLRTRGFSVDQQIWPAALGVGKQGVSNFKFGARRRRLARRGREVGRESRT